MNTGRDRTLDVMRGLAIFLMVQGNIAGSILPHPYPEWAAMYVKAGSFVPALFVMLSGVIVVYTAKRKGYTLKHYLLRSLGLFAAAALVLDVLIWEVVPFVRIEVLYLIALSLPLAYLFSKLPAPPRWFIVGVIFLATPLLQKLLGYSPEPFTISLFHGALPDVLPALARALENWLIDGWFPVFPWLGFSLLGVNLGLLRIREASFGTRVREVALAAAALVAAGVVLWMLYDGPLYIRGGFSEAIYPPTLAYIVTAVGQILLIFFLVDWRPHLKLYHPLIILGESSLFLYLLHYVYIEFLPGGTTVFGTVALIAASFFFIFPAAYLARALRRRHPSRPAFMKYVLGI